MPKRGNRLRLLLLPLLCLSLLGCQSTQQAADMPNVTVPFAVPLAANFRNEIAIARYSELLQNKTLDNDQQAQLFYNRGMLYDSLGLTTLARIDFNRAVKLKPDLAEVYNFLGIHHTLRQEYGTAYEMFDAVLELNTDHEYAYLNRGIALYYGERPALAVNDFEAFLARSPQDPYRLMWLYLAESKVDPVAAKAALKQHSQALNNDEWATQLVQLYLNELSQQAFLAQVGDGVKSQQEFAERLCEAYFYLAKRYQAEGKTGKAIEYFKLALATNVYEFVEHKYARLELQIIADEMNRADVG
ncbi:MULTISPECIES: lipoprotein NlpI [Pseudoalteromonas]|uniref:Lipoprotein NlpI n=1 Tax=Pseudoalteromonas rubra TaxID=43658 RepID=A0A5S3URM8_9GAMM|nr:MULTISPECIES: lipoprotein NlpI [Pseudoalteromonas]MCG7560665.1 lipoprotein NlpI [Pseudoalteromonas sp. McH1-42]MEC4090678.1 lipoprotein NlpI [Pseudoalteromonas rubra]QPB82601.1 lipoprotein NlpI [Pseudoalteromonas rubra]